MLENVFLRSDVAKILGKLLCIWVFSDCSNEIKFPPRAILNDLLAEKLLS
jgi:hypothetical protein